MIRGGCFFSDMAIYATPPVGGDPFDNPVQAKRSAGLADTCLFPNPYGVFGSPAKPCVKNALPLQPAFRIRIIDKLPKIKRFARQGIHISRKHDCPFKRTPQVFNPLRGWGDGSDTGFLLIYKSCGLPAILFFERGFENSDPVFLTPTCRDASLTGCR
jgi:hypothetical protein